MYICICLHFHKIPQLYLYLCTLPLIVYMHKYTSTFPFINLPKIGNVSWRTICVCMCVCVCMSAWWERKVLLRWAPLYIAESSGWQDLVYTGEIALWIFETLEKVKFTGISCPMGYSFITFQYSTIFIYVYIRIYCLKGTRLLYSFINLSSPESRHWDNS